MTEIFTNQPTGGPPPSSGKGPSDTKLNLLIGGAAVFLVIALGVLGWVLLAGRSDDKSNVATAQDNETSTPRDSERSNQTADEESPATPEEQSQDENSDNPNSQVTLPDPDSSEPPGGGGGTTTGGTSGETTGGTPGGTAKVVPIRATASNTRDSVNLRCTNQQLEYVPGHLIDGDPNTGWGASQGDGTDQSAQFDFGGTKQITTVGITPGYLRLAERKAAGCAVVSAFPYNRFIESVRWEFSDGSSVEQSFENKPEMQTTTVNKQTSFVRMVILSTSRPAGADNDTVISEAEFTGTP